MSISTSIMRNQAWPERCIKEILKTSHSWCVCCAFFWKFSTIVRLHTFKSTNTAKEHKSANSISGTSMPPSHWAVSWTSVKFLLPSAEDTVAPSPGTMKSCSFRAFGFWLTSWLAQRRLKQKWLMEPRSTCSSTQTSNDIKCLMHQIFGQAFSDVGLARWAVPFLGSVASMTWGSMPSKTILPKHNIYI